MFIPDPDLARDPGSGSATYLQIDGLAGVDDPVGDGGAVDDAAEHIHEDGLHLHVLGDDAEGLLYLNKQGMILPDHKQNNLQEVYLML